MEKPVPESILREQARQHKREKIKKLKSIAKKKGKKFNSDTIDVKTYKKLTDSRAFEKAENNLRTWLHLAIRLRDLERNQKGEITGHCIACGEEWKVEFWFDGSVKNTKLWCASHFWRADQYGSVEWDWDNIHLSCYNCNKKLSGNLAHYQVNLVKKIGQERFDKLEFRKNQTANLNIIDLIKKKEEAMDEVETQAKRLGLDFYY